MHQLESQEQTPKPNLLDVVEIDGRWAQVIIGGNTVRFLDTKEEHPIDWEEYSYEPIPKIIMARQLPLTPQQYSTLMWESLGEPPDSPKKGMVNVYGRYAKKGSPTGMAHIQRIS